MNDPNKVRAIKRLCQLQNVTMVSILETKVKAHNMLTIQKKLGAKWSWLCHYSCSPKGRIWLGWDANKIIVQEVAIHEQFIHVAVMDVMRQNSMHLSVVYGLHTIDSGRSLWRDLATLAVPTPSLSLSWVISMQFFIHRTELMGLLFLIMKLMILLTFWILLVFLNFLALGLIILGVIKGLEVLGFFLAIKRSFINHQR